MEIKKERCEEGFKAKMEINTADIKKKEWGEWGGDMAGQKKRRKIHYRE